MIIDYNKKHTSAGTTYTQIDEQDLQDLLKNLIDINSQLADLSNNKDINIAQIFTHWYIKPQTKYTRGKRGLNSPMTLINGILKNLLSGTQRDLSMPQLESLELLFQDLEQIEAMSKLSFPKLEFKESLFEFSR
jgi:hypothetical protein